MPEVGSFDAFDALVRSLPRSAIYRGATKSSYDLRPSVGRLAQFRSGSHQHMEKRLLQLFKEGARLHLRDEPRFELEWLAVAQHHGLPTRLLDWTYNPLVALFFAVEAPSDGDAVVYAYSNRTTIPADRVAQYDPFAGDSVIRYRPAYVSERIAAQQGLFTVHPNPREPLDDEDVTSIRIKGDTRLGFKKILSKYGVSWRSLFPSLEGLARDLRWLETKEQ